MGVSRLLLGLGSIPGIHVPGIVSVSIGARVALCRSSGGICGVAWRGRLLTWCINAEFIPKRSVDVCRLGLFTGCSRFP